MRGNKTKGCFGYRTAYKKKRILQIVILAAAILLQLGARDVFEDMNTILTVTAILTVLPMANLASPLLATWKIREVPEALHEACRPYEEEFPVLYGLIITSQDMILPIDAAVIHPSGVFLYCSDSKVNAGKAEKYLNGMLTKWKLDGNARVLLEERSFLKRLSSLKPVSEEEDDGSAAYVKELLKNLSI